MNSIIESINYSSDSYWGDPERFKFNARINDFGNITEINQGDNRIVKTNFTIELQGYLLPKNINKELVKRTQKFFSKSTIIFNDELVIGNSGIPLTREEVRKLQGPLNIE